MRRTSFDTSESQSGLGDITLTAGYIILQESQTLPAVRPLIYLKFPTADEDEGLGTGEFDVGGGLGAVKWFGRWYTFAEGRYIFQGSNSDLGLKDYGTLEGEAGYRLTDRFLPTVVGVVVFPPVGRFAQPGGGPAQRKILGHRRHFPGGLPGHRPLQRHRRFRCRPGRFLQLLKKKVR